MAEGKIRINKETRFLINIALQPAIYKQKGILFREFKQINTILAFHGLEFCQDGNFQLIKKAKILSEAEQRASKLKEA